MTLKHLVAKQTDVFNGANDFISILKLVKALIHCVSHIIQTSQNQVNIKCYSYHSVRF